MCRLHCADYAHDAAILVDGASQRSLRPRSVCARTGRKHTMKYSVMLAALGVLGAGTAVAQQPPIKIGVLYPLTGGGAVYGVPAMAGHQLAVEELNAKGGILGRKIESIERDDKLNP